MEEKSATFSVVRSVIGLQEGSCASAEAFETETAGMVWGKKSVIGRVSSMSAIEIFQNLPTCSHQCVASWSRLVRWKNLPVIGTSPRILAPHFARLFCVLREIFVANIRNIIDLYQ